ncbi:hypothetical protein P691DRAFT_805783 [Macrolepiota fuliginosa MF-IS2]|uniref:Uncharacterized protein n=1 Tax=Macrolepiota fuliginosa MF-IS2 TaxID=1400762 RepID=A0A9P5X6E0_9AGAR|nr:hypothetical protein P691DRAFT_805783 [Macrolepiota fuliginosa MF-IS2]
MSESGQTNYANDAKYGGQGFVRKDILLVWLLGIIFFPFLVVTVIFSFGAPYWYYRCFRWHCANHNQGSATANSQPPRAGTAWNSVLQQAQHQWKIYHALSVIVIPTTVRHFATPAAEKCSWTYNLAVIALLGGMMNLVFTTIFQEYAETLRQTSVAERWLKVPINPRAIMVWVFLSLPTSWFVSSVAASILSMVSSTWIGVTPHVVGDPCSVGHLDFLRAFIIVLALKAFMDLLFMFSTLHAIAKCNVD